jgi:acetyltransferase-like isoleucine patch superfamily enzyme
MPPIKNIFGSDYIAKIRNLLNEDESQLSKVKSENSENITIGLNYKFNSKPPVIGKNPNIRSNSVIYNDVEIGNNFKTGHGVVVREKTDIGDNVLIGTNTVIEGYSSIGSDVSIQSNVYIPKNSLIEDYVFIGPCACFTNDKYPIRIDFDLKGPVIRSGASIGANSTFLSDIEVGKGAMVAAGAIVTMDVPEYFLAIGAPARIKPLPKHLKKLNRIE